MSVTNTTFTANSAELAPQRRPSATALLETVLQAGVFVATASLPVSILAAGFVLGR
jgi:hypothetical protein